MIGGGACSTYLSEEGVNLLLDNLSLGSHFFN